MNSIIVAGIHLKTGEVRKAPYINTSVGRREARRYQERLRARGFITTYIDPLRKERIGNDTVLKSSTVSDAEMEIAVSDAEMEIAANYGVKTFDEGAVKYPYKVHSINTVNQRRQGSHVGFVATLGEAMATAENCVKKWGDGHKGVVIFKAVKLVRRQDTPIEVVDL